MAEDQRTVGAPPLDLFDPGRLKQVAAFVGVTGAGGGGAAALCFGIGYLAVRSHDEMLGLPSRAGASSSMIRVGAMFFPNSLYYLFISTWVAFAVVFAVALVARAVPEDSVTSLRERAPRLPDRLGKSMKAVAFVLVHALLLLVGLLLFEDRAGTLHPLNRQMLFGRSQEQTTACGDVDVKTAESPPAFRYFVVERLKEKACRVGNELRAGDETTRRHFGRSVALLVMFLGLLWCEYVFWREQALSLLQGLIRPVLHVLAAVLVVTLPGAYGVLWMANNANSVEIATTADDPPVTGYLLTEIAGDEPEVWTLSLADTTLTMRVLKRDSISEIRVIANAYTDNMLRTASELPGVLANHGEARDAGKAPSATGD